MAQARRRRTIALGIAVGILATAVTGFGAAIRYSKFVLLKEPVYLREPLYTLSKHVGPWDCIEESGPLSPDVLDVLGTTQYISWRYRDRTNRLKPGSEVRLHVAYYTGIANTVSHVPERCIVAFGADGLDFSRVHLKIDGPHYRKTAAGISAPTLRHGESVTIPQLEFPATIFRYRFSGGDKIHSVVYFFVANGKFLPTPDLVRLEGIDPRDRYSYYCKVEIGLRGVSEPDEAVERASAFLSTMLPEIMRCLPDWQQVIARNRGVERNASLGEE